MDIDLPKSAGIRFADTKLKEHEAFLLLARQNLLQQEIIKIAENYDVYYRHYNSNEKISSYLQRTSRSCNPDIKLFREYLQKEKDPNLTLAASNVHSFHKNGWY